MYVHVGEWISGAVCMYIAEFFATGNNEEVHKIKVNYNYSCIYFPSRLKTYCRKLS